MTILRRTAIAALFTAPFCFSPAFAQDHMMAAEPMMHHDMHVTCSIKDMGKNGMGMTIMFHNMGKEAIPAGSKGHFMVRGMAQGDVHFMDPLAPGAMKEQMYAGGAMMHGSMHAPCSVSMM